MAQTVWESGKLTDVWAPVGRSDEGNVRFRRANFDLLNWSQTGGQQEVYVLPGVGDRFPGQEVNLKDSWQTGVEFGYYGKDSAFAETHFGDGQSDSVFALHSFGFV
jgi:hypothetical protein